MKEVWKDVKGYEGYYQVSNLGRVKSLDRVVLNRGIKSSIKGRILLPHKDTYGYYNAVLYNNGRPFRTGIHRLMCIAFLPNPENKKTVNHIDGIKINNYIDNLEWNTHSENVLHSIRIGTAVYSHRRSSHLFKLKEPDVMLIINGYLSENKTMKELALKYSVSSDTIWDIINRRTWKYLT